jgi:hypothetical protein
MDRFFQMKHDFEAESDQELSCKSGDIVVSTNKPRGEWIKACRVGNRVQKGFVPVSFLQSVPDPTDLTPTKDVPPKTAISVFLAEEPEYAPMEWRKVIMRDVWGASQSVVQVGLDMGKRATNFGFSIGMTILNTVGLSAVSKLLGVAESATKIKGDDSPALEKASPGLHASLTIVKMLLELTAGLQKVPLTSLVSGLKHLQQLQDQERAEHEDLSTSLGIVEGAELARLMTMACAAYGNLVLRMLRVIGPTESVENTLLKDYEVVDQKSYSNLYHPGWLVLHHAERKELYLVIRGTASVPDLVTDCVRLLILSWEGIISLYISPLTIIIR